MIYTVSSVAEFADLRREIREYLNFVCQYRGEQLFVAVNEAVNNALLHGTKQKSNEHVKIVIKQDGESLYVIVSHTGDGIREAESCTGLDDLWAENGRGLAIIRHFTDSAEYNARGNEITLKQNLGTATGRDLQARGKEDHNAIV